jgi:hypothetical protein
LVEVEVSNLEKRKSKKLNALADIGATLRVLPEKIAREIGIEAKEEDIFETGTGPIKVKEGWHGLKFGKKKLLLVFGYRMCFVGGCCIRNSWV